MDAIAFDAAAHLIGHSVDAGEWFQFVGLTLRWPAIRAAVPDLLSIAAVVPNDLSQVGKGVCPAAADDDGQTGIELIGGELVDAVTARSSIPRTMFSRAQLPSYSQLRTVIPMRVMGSG